MPSPRPALPAIWQGDFADELPVLTETVWRQYVADTSAARAKPARLNEDLLWAAPDARPSAGQMLEKNDWTSHFKANGSRALLLYFECNILGYDTLREVTEINPKRRGGVPVLKGTRFTAAQALAELADSSGVNEVAQNFDIDSGTIRKLLEGLSLILMRPFQK